MKLGVFSDVHGNIEALRAVMAALRRAGATRFACCGDVVGYGPNPAEVVAEIQQLGAATVAGNHEWGVVGRLARGDFNAAAWSALCWTRTVLTASDRDWLGGLPPVVDIGPDRLVHAAPSDPGGWDYVISTARAGEELAGFGGRVCFAGHTHQPLAVARRNDGPAERLAPDQLVLEPGTRYFLNPGSVGQPRDGDPRAGCLLFDDAVGTVEFLRVEYDIAAVRDRMRRAGLPRTLADRLEVGR
ncbi:metallophosphoesterase family protein [candidate division WOR-3 bacterium]|nr:metallophosphoesterase family protein [candidate division WOR-3 bacterium]